MDNRNPILRGPPFKPLELTELSISITLVSPNDRPNLHQFLSESILEKETLGIVVFLASHDEVIEKIRWMVIHPSLIVEAESR
jgi:hypothetical protein